MHLLARYACATYVEDDHDRIIVVVLVRNRENVQASHYLLLLER